MRHIEIINFSLNGVSEEYRIIISQTEFSIITFSDKLILIKFFGLFDCIYFQFLEKSSSRIKIFGLFQLIFHKNEFKLMFLILLHKLIKHVILIIALSLGKYLNKNSETKIIFFFC